MWGCGGTRPLGVHISRPVTRLRLDKAGSGVFHETCVQPGVGFRERMDFYILTLIHVAPKVSCIPTLQR